MQRPLPTRILTALSMTSSCGASNANKGSRFGNLFSMLSTKSTSSRSASTEDKPATKEVGMVQKRHIIADKAKEISLPNCKSWCSRPTFSQKTDSSTVRQNGKIRLVQGVALTLPFILKLTVVGIWGFHYFHYVRLFFNEKHSSREQRFGHGHQRTNRRPNFSHTMMQHLPRRMCCRQASKHNKTSARDMPIFFTW